MTLSRQLQSERLLVSTSAGQNKAKRERAANGDGSSPEPDQESTPEPEPEPEPKKRGRKPGSQKRKGEDIEEETPATKRKKGRPSKAGDKANDTLSSSERKALQAALKKVMEHVKDIEVPDSDPEPASDDDSDDGPPTRIIIGPFLGAAHRRETIPTITNSSKSPLR